MVCEGAMSSLKDLLHFSQLIRIACHKDELLACCHDCVVRGEGDKEERMEFIQGGLSVTRILMRQNQIRARGTAGCGERQGVERRRTTRSRCRSTSCRSWLACVPSYQSSTTREEDKSAKMAAPLYTTASGQVSGTVLLLHHPPIHMD